MYCSFSLCLEVPFLMTCPKISDLLSQHPQSHKPVPCNTSLNIYLLLVLFLWLNPDSYVSLAPWTSMSMVRSWLPVKRTSLYCYPPASGSPPFHGDSHWRTSPTPTTSLPGLPVVVTYQEIPSDVSCIPSDITFWSYLPDLSKPPPLNDGCVYSQVLSTPNLSSPIQNDIQLLMPHE